ncbi:hypothetical protein QUB11_03060 [Microcoleus sp. B6-A1]|uniref:hypothetical protein n=1 Tax=Microcoleus sp. B6-A1 TaxID=2818684 RepID=UPI002FD43F66
MPAVRPLRPCQRDDRQTCQPCQPYQCDSPSRSSPYGATVQAVPVLTNQSPQKRTTARLSCNFGAVPTVPAVRDVEPIAPCRSDCRQFWSLIGGKPY